MEIQFYEQDKLLIFKVTFDGMNVLDVEYLDIIKSNE